MYYSADTFSWNAEVGRVFTIQSASLSIASCFLFLGYLVYHGARYRFKGPIMGLQQWKFLDPLVNHYLLILLISDLDFAFASLLHTKWAALARIGDPSITAHKEFMKAMANLSIALSASGMALHTFSVLFFHWRPPAGQIFPFTALAIIWVFAALTSVTPHESEYKQYSSVSMTWYLIGDPKPGMWFSYRRVDLWFAAAINIGLYVALAVYLRRRLAPDAPSDADNQENNDSGTNEANETTTTRDVEECSTISHMRRTLAYPILYIILVAPMSIVRFAGLINPIPPSFVFSDPAPSNQPPYNVVFFAFSSCLALLFCFLTPRFQLITSPRTERGTTLDKPAVEVEQPQTGKAPACSS